MDKYTILASKRTTLYTDIELSDRWTVRHYTNTLAATFHSYFRAYHLHPGDRNFNSGWGQERSDGELWCPMCNKRAPEEVEGMLILMRWNP